MECITATEGHYQFFLTSKRKKYIYRIKLIYKYLYRSIDSFWSGGIQVRSTATWPTWPRLGGRRVVSLELHSQRLRSLELYGRDESSLAHTGGLCFRSARRADAAGPCLHPSCRLVHTAADRPWPGHTSPEQTSSKFSLRMWLDKLTLSGHRNSVKLQTVSCSHREPYPTAMRIWRRVELT
jgi:hypothetical protein